MCTGKCCDPMNEKQCTCAAIIFFAIITGLQIAIIVSIESFIEVYNNEYTESPFYDLELSETNIENKRPMVFFDFYGRKRVLENGTTQFYDSKSFDKLLGQKFLYKEKDRNYYDYKDKYSVDSGNNCPSKYKKCGTLDSIQRILCLPEDEKCPLNGLGISKSYPDSKYQNYEYKKVYDSIDNSEYYIYYTNNNIEGNIITELKLSHGPPCAVSYQISWTKVYNNEVDRTLNCSTEVDGSSTSKRYSKASDEGINLLSLYKDNGLTEASSYDDNDDYKVDLYVRNYDEMNEECNTNQFLYSIRNDEIYYDVLEVVIRILSCVFIVLIIVVEVILLRKCCFEKKFIKIGFAAPIFGVIYNIINIILFTRNFNDDDCQMILFKDKQKDNNELNLILSVVSCLFSIFSLWTCVELKFIDKKLEDANGTSSEINGPQNSKRDYPSHNARNIGNQNIAHQPSSTHAIRHKKKRKK